MGIGVWVGVVLIGILLLVALYDVFQKKHAILRNFPVIGHFRYIFEAIGPELRQYIVTSNDEERPFSRDQRSWVYASAKKQNNYFGFGTDNDLETSPNYLIVKQAAFAHPEPRPGETAYDPHHRVPCAKVIGGHRGRERAFRPESIVMVSAMSYGSLSGPAVAALNEGCRISGSLHNTGEGGVSEHHRKGGDLVWQLGTGYFGARDPSGGFSMEKLVELVERTPSIRAIEVKLSQGAKPGRGGVLPKEKITPEISEIRGIPMGVDCISPASHSAFRCADSLLDFVESIAARTGLPVGIKSAVGQIDFWDELARLMESGDRGVDFIQIDGGEGGTGAAPLVFADHVSLPFKLGFSRVFGTFAKHGVQHDLVWFGSGRLGFPASALFAFALGADMIAMAREPMMAIGCIQAQRCHTGHCPTGVATQNRWLVRGLDPTSKAVRLANYMVTLRKEIMWLCRACGAAHPGEVNFDNFEILDEAYGTSQADEVFGYSGQRVAVPPAAMLEEVRALMAGGPTVLDALRAG